jgi:hypothetical protein
MRAAQGIVVVLWSALLLTRMIVTIRDPGLALDSDDALRLVQVRDLLAGQSWFDLTQYRMTPPLSVAMHWSRLIDAPLAGLILLFRPFTGQPLAEALAVTIWPTLLLLPTWLTLGRIARRLADPKAASIALLLAIGCVYVFGFFRPGEIDHHNAHLALTLIGLVLLLDFERSRRSAAACAAVNAVSLCIGIESLPYVLSTCLVVSGLWIARGTAISRSVRAFGFGFAATSLLLLFAVVSDHERYSGACDTFSGIYALLAVTGSMGLAGATYVPAFARSIAARASSITLLAAGLFMLAFTLAPQCLRGPYPMLSPELYRIWLLRVEEAQSPLVTASGEIGFFFATYVYAVFGFGMTLVAIFLVERSSRVAAMVVAVFAAVALAVATLEARGIPFALLAGIPAIAVMIRLAQRWLQPGFLRTAATVAAAFVFSEFAFLIFGNYALEGEKQVEARVALRDAVLDCMGEKTTTQLAMLPKGRVADLLAAAPAVLLYTGDSVMAASYHRDATAILDIYRLFTETPDESAAIIRKYGIDYVATCSADEDYAYYIQEGGLQGLLSQLDKGHRPAWLSPYPLSGPAGEVRVYKVLRDRLPV